MTVVRAANFMKNWAWSMQAVKEKLVLPSMFCPIGKALPMVSALDIGRCVAQLLLEKSTKRRIIELRGPEDYSPMDAARALSEMLGHHIEAVEDNDADWAANMVGKGFPQTIVTAFVEMFAGFNSGLIAFEGAWETMRGQVSLRDALSAILQTTNHH